MGVIEEAQKREQQKRINAQERLEQKAPLNEFFKKYLEAGISIINVGRGDKGKAPSVGESWKRYQKELMTEEDFRANLDKYPQAVGIGIIAGGISGMLEVIDFDLDDDLSGDLWDRARQKLREYNDDLFASFYIVRTQSGGRHIYYRCPEGVEGSMKLASRAKTVDEKVESREEGDSPKVLIETRGEGGYVVAFPTRGYTIEQGSFELLPTVSAEQREDILSICRSFNKYDDEKKTIREKKVRPDPTIWNATRNPFEEYKVRTTDNDLLALLEKHGWELLFSTSTHHNLKRPGKRSIGVSATITIGGSVPIFYVFSTNSSFECNRGFNPVQVFCHLECGGDWKLCCKKLGESGFGVEYRKFEIELLEGVVVSMEAKKSEVQIKADIASEIGTPSMAPAALKTETEAIYTTFIEQFGPELKTFWEVKNFFSKGKWEKKVKIVKHKFISFLEGRGFSRFVQEEGQKTFVFEKDRLIEEVKDKTLIKEVIMDYISTLPDVFDFGLTPDDILDALLNNVDTYFSEGLIDFVMNESRFKLLEDDANSAHIPFVNTVVKVTKDLVEAVPYSSMDSMIWKNQVIGVRKRDVRNFEIDIDPLFEPHQSEYYQFLQQISKVDNAQESEVRLRYLMALIGYNLHGYKDPTKPYATILCELTDKSEKGGGTGKGLFMNALDYLIPVRILNGKSFDPQGNFAYQSIDADHRLICLDDCTEKLDFEKYNSVITSGLDIEKKNKNSFYLPYSKSPKWAFSTNYSIINEAEHSKRRQRVFELSPTFNATYTPETLFGHRLFDNWDKSEWNRFFNLMFHCIQVFLTDGIRDVPLSSMSVQKAIKTQFGDEFYDFIPTLIEKEGQVVKSADLYDQFLEAGEVDAKYFSKNRWGRALAFLAGKNGIQEVEKGSKKEAGKAHKVIRVKLIGKEYPDIHTVERRSPLTL